MIRMQPIAGNGVYIELTQGAKLQQFSLTKEQAIELGAKLQQWFEVFGNKQQKKETPILDDVFVLCIGGPLHLQHTPVRRETDSIVYLEGVYRRRGQNGPFEWKPNKVVEKPEPCKPMTIPTSIGVLGKSVFSHSGLDKVAEQETKKLQCECGAEKARTSHSKWCPSYKE